VLARISALYRTPPVLSSSPNQGAAPAVLRRCFFNAAQAAIKKKFAAQAQLI
jgi:hypothetical protein